MANVYLVAAAVETRINGPRVAVLSAGLTPVELLVADDVRLLSLQRQLCMGDAWGTWVYPEEFQPNSYQCERQVLLASVIPDGMDAECAEARQVWREIVRVGIAMRLFPSKNGVISKCSTIQTTLRTLGPLTRRIAERPDPAKFWSRISRDEAKAWCGTRALSSCGLLSHYKAIGCLADAPIRRPKPQGTDGPRDRSGEPEPHAETRRDIKFQPLPDTYTSAAGWRSVEFVRVIGPTLLDALEAAVAVPLRTLRVNGKKKGQPVGQQETWRIKRATLDPIIAGWNWVRPDGSPLDRLPFDIDIGLKAGRTFSWPPTRYSEAWAMLGTLQSAHLFPVLLATGGRAGEVKSMRIGCLRQVQQEVDRVEFTTYKLEREGGRQTGVPVPPIVVEAIQQQERLARIVKQVAGLNGDHLWVQIAKHPGDKLRILGPSLKTYASNLGLTNLLDDTNPHPHRYRKTLARIIAMALVHAPKILMDVFGHRDEQMTVMRYILSDPAILSEIQQVVQELIILKAVDVIKTADSVQGGGADRLRQRVQDHITRVGSKAMEPQNLFEFARAMTENGSDWAIIAPGIVCTSFKRGGTCNRFQGQANTSLCSPYCENQLTLPQFERDGQFASAVANAIQVVDQYLEGLQQAIDENDEMLIAQFAGQVRAWFSRWREVDQYFADHPLVRRHVVNVRTRS